MKIATLVGQHLKTRRVFKNQNNDFKLFIIIINRPCFPVTFSDCARHNKHSSPTRTLRVQYMLELMLLHTPNHIIKCLIKFILPSAISRETNPLWYS